MPISGSSSRSSATRCSAERPCSPNASRSPRTSRTRLSAVTRPSAAEPPPVSRRPVWQGSSRAASLSITPSRNRASMSAEVTSRSDMPVQPDGTTSSAWYSSAVSPTAAALTRSGMSLVTRMTSPCPTGPALGGQVERAGQDPAVVGVGAKPGREHLRVGVVELDVQRPASGADRHRCVQAAVLDAQLVEHAQRRAGEPAQLGVVPLALELGDDHQRQHDLVLVEPGQRPRVGQQHRRVEHVAAGGVRVGGGTTIRHGSSLVGAAPRPHSGWAGRPWSDLRDSGAANAREGRVPAPSGASNTTTRASPGGPHRIRTADPNATGGHPGAVNSNARCGPPPRTQN